MTGIFKPPFPIMQIAFVVPDAKAAAAEHSRRYGSGPFFAVEHYKFYVHRYRGVDSPLDVTSVYGQWGNVTAEFIQQHDNQPSAYRDLVKEGESRIHHFALFVDDLEKEMAIYKEQGFDAALYAEALPGLPYAIMDTSSVLGVMTEFYEEWTVKPFYDYMKRTSLEFDGTNPVRELDFHDLEPAVKPA